MERKGKKKGICVPANIAFILSTLDTSQLLTSPLKLVARANLKMETKLTEPPNVTKSIPNPFNTHICSMPSTLDVLKFVRSWLNELARRNL